MKDSNNSPLPPPRNNVNMKMKKPVPLPRKNVNVNTSDLKDGSSSTSSNSKGINVLLPEITMASEHGLERKKSVIENTRSVSICIEKSFRNFLPRTPRRRTISLTSEDSRPDISESPIDNDIFSTLSFDSPIPSDSNSEKSLSNYYSPPEFYISQPPNFPPPPLPQVVYDTLPISSNSSSQCGSFSTENIYELISNGQTKPQVYENWNLTSEKSISSSDTSNICNETKQSKSDSPKNLHQTCLFTNEETCNDTKSDVLQFDPLYNFFGGLSNKEKEENNKCELLQEIDDEMFSIHSHYSIIEPKRPVFNSNLEDSNENLIPEPPERTDSIQTYCKSLVLQTDDSNSIDCIEEIQVDPVFVEKPRKNSIKRWISSLKNVSDGSTGLVKNKKSPLKPEEEVDFILYEDSCDKVHNGILLVSFDEKNKDFEQRWCQIVRGQFQCTIRQTQVNQTGLNIPIESLSCIQTVDEPKQKDGVNIYCFKLKFKSRSQPILLGAICTTERCIWMKKLIGSATDLFPLKLSSEFSIARCATLKEGINGEWRLSWLLLHNRELEYTKQTCGTELIDLRKVRNVVTQEDENLGKSVLVIDYITKSIYLLFEEDSEIGKWQQLLKAETLNTSPQLKDQQLSKDQVPVIVEKCVKFIYAHGCFTEGIYRRSGSVANTTKLLSAFLKDAWAVQLSLQEYTVYDVASALKRFFRDLPEPVFTKELHMHICNAVKCNYSDEKVIRYRSLLERLPDINYVTVRKLLSHLYNIQLQSEKNLMTAQNLASIWGPTLMHIIEDSGSLNWSKMESEAVNDLIVLYPKVFSVADDEMKLESRIMKALVQHNLSNGNVTPVPKPSGDLIIWVYLSSKDCGDCVSVTLSPSKTALMVCDELQNKMGACGGYLLGLQEVVCNGTMIRPIHHTEFLLEIVLMWAYWDVKYGKDNYIVCLQPNSLLIEIMPFTKEHLTFCAQLKFAHQKSKSFKSHLFEITEGKIICYKDKSGSSSLYEWLVKDIIWYIGFEPKRNPHARWCVTFILKKDLPKELKDNFGWSIAGSTKEDHLRWMAALLQAEYGDQISPPMTNHLFDF